MNRSSIKIKGRQDGLTILEVLIALAILSLGLAGLAIMHMNSLKYAHSAYYRSVASAVALDFEERLWLELADTSVLDCPDASNAGDAFTALAADWRDRYQLPNDHWSGFDTRTTQIRDLTITPGTVTTTTFAELPITLSWTDARFDDTTDESIVDESDTESYDYTVRMFCKASSTGSLPPVPITP
ncbi:MAG: prepilin-type N-terminal cleavage/methylation domain-containing protein [Gammaproteobacteria bacterium]|nr:prepilin-type N-terminal cleavage/methylation domain-containing protein [Gammaproteobacteria bacterium]